VAVLHYRPLLALHPAGRCDVVMKAEHPDAINGRGDTFGVQPVNGGMHQEPNRVTAAQAETGEVTQAERGYRLLATCIERARRLDERPEFPHQTSRIRCGHPTGRCRDTRVRRGTGVWRRGGGVEMGVLALHHERQHGAVRGGDRFDERAAARRKCRGPAAAGVLTRQSREAPNGDSARG
jgi:hypothetical protein